MAQQKGPGPAGDGTKGVLAKPTVADQLAAEKAARGRQDDMGWELTHKASPRVNGAPPKGATPKKLTGGQRRDLARRIRAKLGLAANKKPQQG
jgi:hypothetical protein